MQLERHDEGFDVMTAPGFDPSQINNTSVALSAAYLFSPNDATGSYATGSPFSIYVHINPLPSDPPNLIIDEDGCTGPDNVAAINLAINAHKLGYINSIANTVSEGRPRMEK